MDEFTLISDTGDGYGFGDNSTAGHGNGLDPFTDLDGDGEGAVYGYDDGSGKGSAWGYGHGYLSYWEYESWLEPYPATWKENIMTDLAAMTASILAAATPANSCIESVQFPTSGGAVRIYHLKPGTSSEARDALMNSIRLQFGEGYTRDMCGDTITVWGVE